MNSIAKYGCGPKPLSAVPGLVDLGNPGMLQAAEHLRFLLETTEKLTGWRRPGLITLRATMPARVFLLSLVDAAHSAFAD